MKKTFCLIISLLVFTLCGCNQRNSQTAAISQGLSFTAEIDYDAQKYKFKVQIPDIQNVSMEAVYPDRLKGTLYKFSGSEVNVSCKELDYKINISDLPKVSPITFIYEIYSDINANDYEVSFENDEFYISGESENYSYNLFLGRTGLPIKIEDNENNISAVITEASIIND